ncbi:MAG: DeoR family transcriptional regulator, partial [Chloroflexi bacterium]|nr:DeoR family transcriptional regulator [Chloroflexota bacterium]
MATTVETRRFQILQHLSHSDVASVTDLSNLFGVSEMTIRRDLDALADEGLVHRMRGGAAVANRARRQLGERGLTLERHIEPDVVIINPMEPRMARMIVQEASQRGAPIISESTLFQGSTTLVAIDSFRAGVSLGEWVGRYVRDRFGGQARVLFVGFPSFWDTAERQRGFFEGLRGIVPDPEFSLSVNGQGVRDESRAMVEAALLSYPDVNIIIGSNDQSALGALDALRHLGMRVDGILIGTFGLEGPEGRRELMLRCPRSVGVAMFPELIGRVCLDVAIKAYNRLPLPGHVVTPTVVVTGETLCDYYDCCEDHWTIRWDVVQGLPKEIWSRDAALLSRDQAREFPRVVDFVRYLH